MDCQSSAWALCRSTQSSLQSRSASLLCRSPTRFRQCRQLLPRCRAHRLPSSGFLGWSCCLRRCRLTSLLRPPRLLRSADSSSCRCIHCAFGGCWLRRKCFGRPATARTGAFQGSDGLFDSITLGGKFSHYLVDVHVQKCSRMIYRHPSWCCLALALSGSLRWFGANCFVSSSIEDVEKAPG